MKKHKVVTDIKTNNDLNVNNPSGKKKYPKAVNGRPNARI
jgi:hypothetical protein